VVVEPDVVMSWDRSAIPADIELWAPRTLLAYDDDLTQRYGELYLTCASATDASTGRCAVEDMSVELNGETSIAVTFTESRTGSTTDIDVVGWLYRIDSVRNCNLGYWRNSLYGVTSSVSPSCMSMYPAAGTGKGLSIRAASLQDLTAGHWKGTLELRLRRPPSEQLATYNFSFDFTVTDFDAISIYLPEFEQGNAHINMDLRYDPINKRFAGSKDVDMCLYDGLGSQSNYLGVTMRDEGPRPPGGDGFSIWHRDTSGNERERVDYDVFLNYAGSRRRMRNGVEEQLLGVDTTALRLVKLPNVHKPVYCVPTPITLQTPSFEASKKREGLYTGGLKVELRVPTARP